MKRIVALSLVLFLSIESFAAVVSDNDGSAFITKAEFDSLKNNFQAQIDQYNTSIDSKIDGAIASYLAGINVQKEEELKNLYILYIVTGCKDDNTTLKWVGSSAKSINNNDKQTILWELNLSVWWSRHSSYSYGHLTDPNIWSMEGQPTNNARTAIGTIPINAFYHGYAQFNNKTLRFKSPSGGAISEKWGTNPASIFTLTPWANRIFVDKNGNVTKINNYAFKVCGSVERFDWRGQNYSNLDLVGGGEGSSNNITGPGTTFKRSNEPTQFNDIWWHNIAIQYGMKYEFIYNDVSDVATTDEVFLDPIGSSYEYVIPEFSSLPSASIPTWYLGSGMTCGKDGYIWAEPVATKVSQQSKTGNGIYYDNTGTKWSIGWYFGQNIDWFIRKNSKELIFNDFKKISDKNMEIKKGIVIAEATKDYDKVKVEGKAEENGWVILYAKENADENWNGKKTEYENQPSKFRVLKDSTWKFEIEDVKKNNAIFMIYIPDSSEAKAIEITKIQGVSG